MKFRTILHRLLLGLALVAGFGCSRPISPEFQRTQSLEQTQTPLHEDEVRRLIENYYLRISSREVQEDRTLLSSFVTDPFLSEIEGFRGYDGTPSYTQVVHLDEVHVVAYTPNYINAVACGEMRWYHPGNELATPHASGDLIQTVYVFLLEDGVWKLATAYSFPERSEAIRDWRYVSEEAKTLIGNIDFYIDVYGLCAYGR